MRRPPIRRFVLPLALAAGSLASLALASPASASFPPLGTGAGGFSLTQVGTFNRPVYADNAPGTGHNLYVVESDGVIRVLDGTRVRSRPFLDIRDRVKCCGEEGLLSIAFHPDYRSNRLFYAYFTNRLGDIELVEFKRSRDRRFVASPGSARTVLYIPHPTFGNHNGGQLQFGPTDLLHISTGDGGSGGDPANNAQNPDSLLGKLLRIDPLLQQPGRPMKKNTEGRTGTRARPYGIPKSNPFVGKPGRNEVYALGLRNPFRFWLDSLSGGIAIGDVGQGCREEIDFRNRGGARGANFGWSGYEGSRVFDASRVPPAAVPPRFEYDNSGIYGPGGAVVQPECSPLGGFRGVSVIAGPIVRDQRLSSLFGRIIYTDVDSSDIRSLPASESPVPGNDERSTGVINPAGVPFSFAEGYKNRVFLISGAGPVYRLNPG